MFVTGLDNRHRSGRIWRCYVARRQLNFSIRGELYEKAFDGSHRGFYQSSPRADDYGIDAIATFFVPLMQFRPASGTFGVQIRGPGCNLQFEERTKTAALGNRMKLNGCVLSLCL